MDKQTAIIIPARFGSSRLEGKPLLKACNKPIIQWVWEKARACKLVDRVIIATDDERIYNACKLFGAEVEMTSDTHKSGSDRIAEVAKRHPEIGYIINLQGDEPLIEQDNIELVIQTIKFDDKADISTLVRKIDSIEEIENPNLVKCVFDINNYAMYFSRSKIPFERGENNNNSKGRWNFYGHLGIYGFKREALFKMTELKQAPYEIAESLEQLRALQNGMKIKVAVVDNIPVGIDTLEDFEKFKAMVEG